jgi:hypothetical protein
MSWFKSTKLVALIHDGMVTISSNLALCYLFSGLDYIMLVQCLIE